MTGELLAAVQDPTVSALVRELADVEAEYSAAKDMLREAQKTALIWAGKVGAVHTRLGAVLRPGDSVTVKVGAQVAITVAMPENTRGAPVCTRSRIVA